MLFMNDRSQIIQKQIIFGYLLVPADSTAWRMAILAAARGASEPLTGRSQRHRNSLCSARRCKS